MEFDNNGLSDGNHHGRGSRVAQPHRQERCHTHEPEHQPEKSILFVIMEWVGKVSF